MVMYMATTIAHLELSTPPLSAAIRLISQSGILALIADHVTYSQSYPSKAVM